MNNFKAVTFNGKKTAHKVLNAIDDSTYDYYWIDDVAEISVSKNGRTKIHSTWAQDSSAVGAGVGFGAMVGGLIGMLFGPGGALVGASLAGSVGGLIGHHENVKFDDPKLDDFAASLLYDTSALIVIGTDATIIEFTNLLAEFADDEFTSYELALDDVEIAALEDEMAY